MVLSLGYFGADRSIARLGAGRGRGRGRGLGAFGAKTAQVGGISSSMDSVIQAVSGGFGSMGLVAEVRLNRMEEGMTGATTETEGFWLQQNQELW
ncbi:hypothetical protein HOLleu_37147 [Holothuria leucospilota]|uniref:Uncharacterized protein n=1 Tax=Holothuria leucospilota TaxID=206669 RepID=A0A9Q1BF28_HOLLE|nr:hypothetical protein HOLleu_37147 [Holothuria leucospilota]